MKVAPTRRAHKETQTPSPCESTLAVEFGLAIYFISARFNRLVARLRISLSSGIRMFARWSETREDLLNHCFFCRAELRIPNQSKWIRLTAVCREFVRLRGANVRFRFAYVEEPTNVLSNFSQINRRGHSNATTKAYAKSRPKTHRAHILMPLLRFMLYRATNRLNCAETEVYC